MSSNLTSGTRFGSVAGHGAAWELVMAGLAIAFVVVGFAAEADDASRALGVIDLGLTMVFVAEFAARFLASFDRAASLRGHWIDLVALVPSVRGFRLLRLLRLLRLVRAFGGLYRAMSTFEPLYRHRGLLLLLVIWVAVLARCRRSRCTRRSMAPKRPLTPRSMPCGGAS